jgi:hypothetical protein
MRVRENGKKECVDAWRGIASCENKEEVKSTRTNMTPKHVPFKPPLHVGQISKLVA